MAEDWAVDVKKYAPNADDAVISRIVAYCGIALRNRDSSLVSFTDPQEIARVRDNYCRKKLGLTDPDPVIDAAILRVGEQMSGDPTKNRVTVYYLLADAFGKLGLFGSPSAPAALDATVASGMVAASPAGAMPAFAFSDEDEPPRRAAARAAASRGDGSGYGGFALAVFGVLAVIVIGTATLGSLIGGRSAGGPVITAAPQAVVAPVAAIPSTNVAVPAIPEGAGVTAQDVEGKPMVSVYFDTAKADIAPDFAAAAAPVKAWIDGHPGARLAVSGFNDSRGNAAFNAELSKNRAMAVAAALVEVGVPADAIDLEKPPETTDTDASLSQARGVDIVVKDAG